MPSSRPGLAGTPLAQAFTEDMIARCGIAPGMRVLVAGADAGEVALLVAERVGSSGSVVGVDTSAKRLACAGRRAREQRFDNVTWCAAGFSAFAEAGYDAVLGRFVLMSERDPVCAIRDAARAVRPGGRIAFVEWHLESLEWQHTSAWPDESLHARAAARIVEAMRRRGQHPDAGLRLVNAFVAAGLPLPVVRTELRALGNNNPHGFALLAQMLHDASGMQALSRVAASHHAFLPLLVGAYARREPRCAAPVSERAPPAAPTVGVTANEARGGCRRPAATDTARRT